MKNLFAIFGHLHHKSGSLCSLFLNIKIYEKIFLYLFLCCTTYQILILNLGYGVNINTLPQIYRVKQWLKVKGVFLHHFPVSDFTHLAAL